MMLALTIALLTGTTLAVVLISRLRDKSWMEQGVVAISSDGGTSSPPQVGLWVLMGMLTSLFGLFIAAYLMRMGHGHGTELTDWHAVSKPALLWLNTAVLVLASVAMQKSKVAAERGDLAADISAVRSGFLAGGVLTAVFLAGQFWVWLQLQATGQYTASSPAYAFFILLTAVHALHLIGGLVVWTKTAAHVLQGLEKADLIQIDKVRLSVQLCTVYWHYLLLVWLLLFVLLLLT